MAVGDATGMRWFRRKPKPVITWPTLVCDICNASLSSTGFYFLTSREVLVSPAYWRRRLDIWLTMAAITGASESEMVRQSAASAAAQGTPWVVCETCSVDFTFDRAAARAHAVARTEPPGSGRVDERLCVDMAERAFAERRRGPA